MAITVTAGTNAANAATASLNVTAPTLAADDLHVIVAAINAATPTIATPTGYTALGPRTLTSSGGGGSTTASMYVFYRLGTASSGTVTLTGGSSGRMSAVPATFSGVDTTTPVQASSITGTYLTAPSLTATSTSTHLLAAFAVREGTSAGGFTITQPSGFTETGESVTVVGSAVTMLGTELSYKTVSAGATGTQAATTTANTGFIAAPIAVLLNAGSASATAPATPTISTTAGNASVNVTWTAPANGGSAITGYTLQRRTYTGGTPGSYSSIGVGTITSGSTSFNDTGVSNGTQYGYHLLATNAVNSSSYSTESVATPASSGGAGTGFIGYLQSKFGADLIHYWPLNDTYQAQDVIGTYNGTVHGTVTFTSTGASFSGASGNYISIADANDLSLINQASDSMCIYHGMAVSDWSSTSNLRGDGFVHYMGKGSGGSGPTAQQEYVNRYYPDSGASGAPGYDSTRQKRTSGYHYVLTGGTGTGSYAQDNPANNEEQVMCVCYDRTFTTNAQASSYWGSNTGANGFGSSAPGGTFVAKNGVPRDCDGFTSGGGGSNITPANGTAPFTIGCRSEQDSWMKGKIRRVMFFRRKLTTAEVLDVYNNWGLAEGTTGGGSQNTVPGAVQNASAVRSSSDSSLGTVSWSTPASNGGAAIDGYRVSWVGGTGSFTSTLLSTSASPYGLVALPNAAVTVTIQAHNSVGYGPGTNVVIPATVSLSLAGSLTDDFNTSPDPNRSFDTGVTQTNGEIEWTTVDATHRATYVRANMTGQRVFMKVTASNVTNDVVAFFVRNTADRTQNLRIAVQNNVISARDAQTGTPNVTTRTYNATNDAYLSIVDTGAAVLMQTSPDGTTWTTLTHPTINTPAWIADCEIGVEAYNNVTV